MDVFVGELALRGVEDRVDPAADIAFPANRRLRAAARAMLETIRRHTGA